MQHRAVFIPCVLKLLLSCYKSFFLMLYCCCRVASFVVPGMKYVKNKNNKTRPCSVMLKVAVGVEWNET